jgi:hypothetical protein
MYSNEFEENLILAIENVENNPSEINENLLKNYFKNNFDSNKATIFEMFSSDRLTLEQQKILFDSIEVKQKCQLYNTISLDVGLLNIINSKA